MWVWLSDDWRDYSLIYLGGKKDFLMYIKLEYLSEIHVNEREDRMDECTVTL